MSTPISSNQPSYATSTSATSANQISATKQAPESAEKDGSKNNTIQISDEARQKLRELNGAKASGGASASDDKDDGDAIDKAIEQIKERIKQIQEQLKSLANDDSEAAKQMRQELLNQLAQLNGELIQLIQKKLEAAQQAERNQAF